MCGKFTAMASWTEMVEPEPSAAPFHDWNERIYRECYRANDNARIVRPDGVTEAQNRAGDFFGKTRLREAVQAALALDCARMHDAVQAAINEFTGGEEQSDDVTLVVLEFAGARS